MRLMIAATMGAVALLCGVTGAAAQRDASDRMQRLESQEFTDDMHQNRLRQPLPPPFWLQPPNTAPAETPKPQRKKKEEQR